MANSNIEPLQILTDGQLRSLELFAWLDISISQLLNDCRNVMGFEFGPVERRFSGRFQLPQPGVLITKQHVENALKRRHLRIVSERDLVLWATMILLNDAYEIDPSDEDLIAEWLNDLSFELDSFNDEKY
jgi:hypothetical protein